jgi:hypothetical protein
MIKIPPINSNISQTYYNTLKFSFNPTTLTVNISGTFLNQYIQKSITIDKSLLLISNTVLYNSSTVLYTYLTIDLNNFTYTSSISRINSNDPYKCEFLIILDNSLNSINDTINLTSILNDNKTTFISTTAYISLQSFNSLSSNTSNLSYKSLYSFYSLTAEYAKNLSSLTNIGNNINNIFDIQHTSLYVSTSNLSTFSYKEYDSFYNITTKELFVLVSGTWQKVNWQNFIKSDKLYKEGRLRINPSTTALEIQSANGNWYEIVPSIGKVFGPMSFSYIYYIAPNQSVTALSQSKIPLIATNNIVYKGILFTNLTPGEWIGILPSGLLINNGYGDMVIQRNKLTITTSNTYNLSYVPILKCNGWPVTQIINLSIYNNYIYIIGYGRQDAYATSFEYTYGSFPTNGYYLGYWCRSNTTYNVTSVLKRIM